MPRSATLKKAHCVEVGGSTRGVDTGGRHTPSTRPMTRAHLRELLGTPKRPGKYRNQKTLGTGLDGEVIKLDSKREAKRWSELVLRLRAGEISELKRQVRFKLDFEGVKICTYVADFTYLEAGPQGWFSATYVVEDAKGVKTQAYIIKKKLMRARYKIEVREV